MTKLQKLFKKNSLEVFSWNLLDLEIHELHSELIFHTGWLPVRVSIVLIHLIVTWHVTRWRGVGGGGINISMCIRFSIGIFAAVRGNIIWTGRRWILCREMKLKSHSWYDEIHCLWITLQAALAKIKRASWDRFVSASSSIKEYKLVSEYWKKNKTSKYCSKCNNNFDVAMYKS